MNATFIGISFNFQLPLRRYSQLSQYFFLTNPLRDLSSVFIMAILAWSHSKIVNFMIFLKTVQQTPEDKGFIASKSETDVGNFNRLLPSALCAFVSKQVLR